MIYITGDTHAGKDMKKLAARTIREKLTADDTLIICGDFGFIFHPARETRKERSWLRWFASKPWTTLFVDGNHECFPRLYSYPVQEYQGGKVHVIRPNVMHLMRGNMYTLEGKTFFVMGGASSHDRGPAVGDMNADGKGWWKEELPNGEEYALSEKTLNEHARKADYILTHCLPLSLQKKIRPNYPEDALTSYLEHVLHTVSFTHWYCGHYHHDIDIDDHVTVLYRRVLTAGSTIPFGQPVAGSPVYLRNTHLCFVYKNQEYTGRVKYIYPWGIFPQNEPVYDIVIDGTDQLAKSIRESRILNNISE